MSISYEGKSNIKNKIGDLIKEMDEDIDLDYKISIYENRTNEKLNKLMIEIIDIKPTMPLF